MKTIFKAWHSFAGDFDLKRYSVSDILILKDNLHRLQKKYDKITTKQIIKIQNTIEEILDIRGEI